GPIVRLLDCQLTLAEHACKLPPPQRPALRAPAVNTSNSSSDAGETPTLDFERSLAELEALVEKLERGEMSLEESLKAFERGVELTRVCQSALKQAEQKVEILLRRNGELEAAPFDAEDDDRDA